MSRVIGDSVNQECIVINLQLCHIYNVSNMKDHGGVIGLSLNDEII